MNSSARRIRSGILAFGGIGAAIWMLGLIACSRSAPSRPASVAAAVSQTSASCRECHRSIYDAWAGTDHALANRLLDSKADAAAMEAFHPPAGVGPGTVADMILGHKPLWQPLLPAGGGRWQPHELAYDPVRKDWFNVFGTENRQPDEWGHWTGRGMNWNSMCAQCHMTGYRKNYTAATDSYASTWVEQGVGCIQCHGPLPSDHGRRATASVATAATPFAGDPKKIMHTCATCHARAQPLTENFQPGDNYHDHYSIVLPVSPATYYPDGQQREEDFNFTSVLLSRMGHAGVTCMDCHDPHTSKTRFPAQDNRLCLQCHAAPGRVLASGARAVPIDPLAHSHHADGSTGNSCVSCHMPTTNYMQRAPRHDHGWLKPDPLLTKELGIPNACNRCHTDQSTDWAVSHADAWYGDKLDSRQRARTRAVAAAQTGGSGATSRLLGLLKTEDIPAWRATLLLLISEAGDGESELVRQAGQSALKSNDPVERSAAVRLLATLPDSSEQIRPLLQDPVHLVRLDAELALSAGLPEKSPARNELDGHLALGLDQPAGHYRLGMDLANRGRLIEAEQELNVAIKWDPNSAGFLDALGQLQARQNRLAEAAANIQRAAELAAADGSFAMRAGLAWAEAGRPDRAENWLRQAVTRDALLDRGWYNLGLLLAQDPKRLSEAADALKKAAQVRPEAAEYTYALATVLARKGDYAGARAAAESTLRNDPGHSGARALLQSLSRAGSGSAAR